MIGGSCLCGDVTFEIEQAVGPFELCHCPRCRKASGAAFVAGLGVRVCDFRLLSGAESIRTYEAPLRERPPPYRVAFCARCGSPVPDPLPGASWFEIPAGLLDDDPSLRPDKHIYVDCKSDWFAISDGLPQLTETELARLRRRPEDLGRKHEFHGVQPILPVADIVASAEYLRDVLGFEIEFIEGDPPHHARIMKGDRTYGDPVYIHLSRAEPEEVRPSGELRIHVGSDLDGLFETYVARNVDVVFPPVSQPWGLREFSVREINGHVLRFCGEVTPS